MEFVILLIVCLIAICCNVYLSHRDKKEAMKKESQEQEEKAKEEARRRKEEQKKAQKREYELAQDNTYKRLGNLVVSSQTLSQDLTKEIEGAENALNSAEQEYVEGVFAPFWDAIEYAATHLARFDLKVNQIVQNCSQYKTEKEEFDSEPPVFKLNTEDLPNATAVANRMCSIVRKAQKNFQFATIYEQRKTNQLLVSGFTNLAQALGEMSYRIEQSVYSLSASIADLSDTTADSVAKIIESNEQNAQNVIGSVGAVNKQLQSDAEVRREHERKELEMLDNIQRHRKPNPV